jgi:oligoribonuclease NrnB/cAMP/cGMP phosphodiesterase (DHH superfamily)
MTNILTVFTHVDLDAAGCVLNIEYKYPDLPKKYFYTNYANIDEIVEDILEFKSKNNTSVILIPDVSFSDNKPALLKLYNAFEKVYHIDHHMYPEGFWDEFPNMKVVHDKTKSATKLCNEFFKNTGENENLDKLTHIIDVYDIWQVNEKAFMFSQDLNEYFWEVGLEQFVSSIIACGFKLPSDFKTTTDAIKKRYTEKIAYYESKNYIVRSGELTVAFVDEYFNQIMIPEMAKGVNFVVGVNAYGIIRVRINQNCPYSEKILNNIRFLLTGNAEYGHLHAFTYKVSDSSFNNLTKEVQRIANAINESISIKE